MKVIRLDLQELVEDITLGPDSIIGTFPSRCPVCTYINSMFTITYLLSKYISQQIVIEFGFPEPS